MKVNATLLLFLMVVGSALGLLSSGRLVAEGQAIQNLRNNPQNNPSSNVMVIFDEGDYVVPGVGHFFCMPEENPERIECANQNDSYYFVISNIWRGSSGDITFDLTDIKAPTISGEPQLKGLCVMVDESIIRNAHNNAEIIPNDQLDAALGFPAGANIGSVAIAHILNSTVAQPLHEKTVVAKQVTSASGSMFASVVMQNDLEKKHLAEKKAKEDVAAKEREAAAAESEKHWTPRPATGKKARVWKEVKSAKNLRPDVVAVGPHSLWCVEKGNIYRHAKNDWIGCGEGVFVAAGADGTIVSINDKNEVFVHEGGKNWTMIPDVELSRIAVQDSKNMIGLLEDKDGHVSKVMECVDGKWQEAIDIGNTPATGPTAVTMNKLSLELGLQPDGTPVMRTGATRTFVKSEGVASQVAKKIEQHRKKHKKGKKHGHKHGKGVGKDNQADAQVAAVKSAKHRHKSKSVNAAQQVGNAASADITKKHHKRMKHKHGAKPAKTAAADTTK